MIGEVTSTIGFPSDEDFSLISSSDFIICFAKLGSIKSPSELLFFDIEINICSRSELKVTIFKASLTLEIFCISKEEIAGLTASDNSSGLNFLSDKLDKASKIFFKSLIGTLSTNRFLRIIVR